MENKLVLIVYSILAVLSAIFIVYTLIRLRERRLSRNILFLFSMVLCWQIVEVLYAVVQDEMTGRLLYDLKLPFVAFCMVALLLFVMRFYSMDVYLTPNIIIMLFVIPTMTLLICITTNSHEFVRSYIPAANPQQPYEIVSGLWFWFHTAYSYTLALISFFVILFQHRKMPSAFRAPSRVMLVGIMISLVFSYFYATDQLNLSLDPTLLAMSVTSFLLFAATMHNQGVDYLMRARTNVFNNLPQGVFVIDKEGYVRSWNPAFISYLKKFHLDPNEKSFQTIYRKMDAYAEKHVKLTSKNASDDYYLSQRDGGYILNLKQRTIHENSTTDLTSFAVIDDVTDERALTHDVANEAGQDTLTGLLTSEQFYRLVPLIDVPDNWPLTVLIGNLDYLGEVNALFGYTVGDVFLRAAAHTLSRLVPCASLVARTDGDEFIALIPGYSSQRAAELVTTINRAMSEDNTFLFEFSMALGFAIKQSSTQDIDHVIHTAKLAVLANKAFSRNQHLAAAPPKE